MRPIRRCKACGDTFTEILETCPKCQDDTWWEDIYYCPYCDVEMKPEGWGGGIMCLQCELYLGWDKDSIRESIDFIKTCLEYYDKRKGNTGITIPNNCLNCFWYAMHEGTPNECRSDISPLHGTDPKPAGTCDCWWGIAEGDEGVGRMHSIDIAKERLERRYGVIFFDKDGA